MYGQREGNYDKLLFSDVYFRFYQIERASSAHGLNL